MTTTTYSVEIETHSIGVVLVEMTHESRHIDAREMLARVMRDAADVLDSGADVDVFTFVRQSSLLS